jgi:thiol-disulfide isomerase/thioredoxin
MIASVLAELVLLLVLGPAGQEGSELVGKAASSWNEPQWVQGGPLTLEGLRGRLVLLRWWTGPECPYCEASAPYLNEWHEKYASRGLVVIGFYHHKSQKALAVDSVNRLAARFGFRFPIAIDPDWRTLRRWWLDGADRSYTSVSFLLDRNGIIRYVHRGGTYSRENAATIEAEIRKLLEDPTAGRKTRP